MIWLTEADRALVKADCGLELPKADRPAWTEENARYCKPIEFWYGKPMTIFDPKEDFSTGVWKHQKTTAFDIAWAAMEESFTPEEIFDHLRVKTLTASFIFEFDEFRMKEDLMKAKAEDTNHGRKYKPLTEIMALLAKPEPENETVSLKTNIDKLGLRLFEETAPRVPPGPENDTREFGLPGDARCQAYHFVAQYNGLTKEKKKVPYIDFIKATTPTGYGEYQGRPMWTYYDHGGGPEIALEKVHNAKTWFHTSITKGNVQSLLSQKLIRQHIRNNKPVVVGLSMPGEHEDSQPDMKEGYAVLIGFATEQKKSTYEVFMIYGPAYLGSRVYPPITTEYKSKIKPEYFSWAQHLFIE